MAKKKKTPNTVPKDWIAKVQAKTPILIEVGRPAPRLVLSFGGAGFLCTYSLGVAHFLLTERPELVAKSFILGAGSGCIAATALACGKAAVGASNGIEELTNFVVQHCCNVTDEKQRSHVLRQGIERFVPLDVTRHVAGRLALTISFPNDDLGYFYQNQENVDYGHHIALWKDRQDFVDCMMAAVAPNKHFPQKFREADNVLRGTQLSLSSQLDQYIRHVHIHGYCGYKYKQQQTRHNFYFGKHGFLANTHTSYVSQCFAAFMPNVGVRKLWQEHLKEAFDFGFQDARRYERWEEDCYYYAKPDRSPSNDYNWRNIRAMFGAPIDKEEF